MDPHRRLWNEQQQQLRRALLHSDQHQKAIELFLVQHAMVHSSTPATPGLFSFDDEVWSGLSEEVVRRVPPKSEHSIPWTIWHTARIEDITMNLLVAGREQVFSGEEWPAKMKVSIRDTGNTLDAAGIFHLSLRIDIDALRAYRSAVRARTREIVGELRPEEMKRKVETTRLQHLRDEGAVLPAADWLLRYWGGLTISGLLLMPPTRHNFVHLREALRIKQKLNVNQ